MGIVPARLKENVLLFKNSMLAINMIIISEINAHNILH